MPSYYIEARNSNEISCIGYLTKCDECGRKILVSMGLFGVTHNTEPSVTCFDCLKIRPEFEKDFPEIAQQLRDFATGKEVDDVEEYDKHQFAQNEELESNDNGTVFQFKESKILPGTVTGQIYVEDELLFNFYVPANESLKLTLMNASDKCKIINVDWNMDKGKINLIWEGKVRPRVVASYEYVKE